MALIRTETFTNEDGVEMLREFYDNGTIFEGPAAEPDIEPVPSKMEEMQADIAYIKMKMKGM